MPYLLIYYTTYVSTFKSEKWNAKQWRHWTNNFQGSTMSAQHLSQGSEFFRVLRQTCTPSRYKCYWGYNFGPDLLVFNNSLFRYCTYATFNKVKFHYIHFILAWKEYRKSLYSFWIFLIYIIAEMVHLLVIYMQVNTRHCLHSMTRVFFCTHIFSWTGTHFAFHIIKAKELIN